MNNNNYHTRCGRVALTFLLMLCALIFSASANAQNPNKIDLSRLAVLGDSLSQAYHNGVLHDDALARNYVMLLGKQAGIEIRQITVPEPGGYGSRFELRDPNGPLNFLNLGVPPQPVTMTRSNSSVRVNNLAVGGARLRDIINERPDPGNPNDAVFASLGLPWLFDNPPVVRSQLEFVETINPKPTAVILFIGGNDALAAAGSSNLSLLTPADQFAQDYEEIVRRVKAVGANMILVNVPDVTTAAFLIPATDLPAVFRLVPLDVILKMTGLTKNDFVTLRAFPAILDVLSGKTNGPIAENLILRKKMAKQISKTIKKYNKTIAKIAKREKFILIDVNKLLLDTTRNGFDIPGVARLSTKYFGGIASLDGVHVSFTTNGILANLFINAINKANGSSIPLVDVAAIAKTDPLVPKMGSTVVAAPEPTLQDYLQTRPFFEDLANAANRLFNGDLK
ncbi:MAG: SGNH/GDSL hydrolase family protein [Acidobacteriota bacterium]